VFAFVSKRIVAVIGDFEVRQSGEQFSESIWGLLLADFIGFEFVWEEVCDRN
jgi:hypothetical protein